MAIKKCLNIIGCPNSSNHPNYSLNCTALTGTDSPVTITNIALLLTSFKHINHVNRLISRMTQTFYFIVPKCGYYSLFRKCGYHHTLGR